MMKSAPSPVSRALILICEKCGKKISGDSAGDTNVARLLQQSLKATIAESGNKGVARALITTCLNVCPKDAVAVGLVATSGAAPRFFEVDVRKLDDAKAEILAHALS